MIDVITSPRDYKKCSVVIMFEDICEKSHLSVGDKSSVQVGRKIADISRLMRRHKNRQEQMKD